MPEDLVCGPGKLAALFQIELYAFDVQQRRLDRRSVIIVVAYRVPVPLNVQCGELYPSMTLTTANAPPV